MGSYEAEVRRAYIERKGTEAWRESRLVIAEFWETLEKVILSLGLDFNRVRIYQDGLPVCGREADIVRDLAESGGTNYKIVLDLMERGASLEGTESLELLLQEYDRLKSGKDATAASTGEAPGQEQCDTAAKLLQARDRFIADRIDQTLRPGEVGMLFVGALHNVVEHLPATVEVMALEEFQASLPQR